MERFGLRLPAVRALPCSEAYALQHGLLEDSRTHVYAAVAGQTFQGSHGDFAMTLVAQLLLAMTREKGAKAIKLPNAYMGAEKRQEARERAQVTPAERERLRERLRQYSAIPD